MVGTDRKSGRFRMSIGAMVMSIAMLACAPAPTPAVPAGSGCTPPSGSTTLPDGYWAVIVKSGASTSITYDLICWFVGDEANKAAIEDGSSDVPVPNDFYTRNQSTKLRTQTYSSSAVLQYLYSLPSGYKTITPSAVTSKLGGKVAWMTVSGGKVTKVKEQYVP